MYRNFVALKVASKEDIQTRLAEVSGWLTATRDDAAVAETLEQTRSMDRICPLNEAAFFDEFWFFAILCGQSVDRACRR